jgi:hypothetical protein
MQVPEAEGATAAAGAASQQQQQQQQQHQQQQQVDGARAPSAVGALRGGKRFGRVSIQELSTTTALFQGVVTKLASSGDCLVALESLGPVTAYTAVYDTPGDWVQLMPVGMDDQSRLMAVDFVIQDPQKSMLAEAAAAAEAAVHSSDGGAQPEQLQMYQGLLVGTHPAGLMLLQRDLFEEAGHVNEMLCAAERAWEAGNRPPDVQAYGGSILMTDPVRGLHGALWQGAGEAAPWPAAAAGLHQQLEEQLQQLMLGGRVQEDHARSVMARVAELAAGRQAGGELSQVVRVNWLGLVSTAPSLAPQLLASATCAPAPSSMLMYKARLGLHAAAVDSGEPVACDSTQGRAGECSAASQGGVDRVVQSRAGVEPNTTVLCLSASGGVAAVQLLPPAQASQLLSWQSGAVLNPRAVCQLMQWDQLGSGGAVSAADAAKRYLRGLPVPDEAATYEGYEQTPGALDNSTGRTEVVQTTAQLEQQQQQQELAGPVSTVFGDALLMGVQEGRQGDGLLAAGAVLQHVLWQEAL